MLVYRRTPGGELPDLRPKSTFSQVSAQIAIAYRPFLGGGRLGIQVLCNQPREKALQDIYCVATKEIVSLGLDQIKQLF
jgi:hypothetical protein